MSEKPKHPHISPPENKGVCPVCGCEEVDHRNLWVCRCPAETVLPRWPNERPAPSPETVKVPVCRQCLGEGGYYVVEPANPDMKVWLSCTACRPNALSARPIRLETVEVPVEPTEEMRMAAGRLILFHLDNNYPKPLSTAIWAAMLSARPTTVETGVEPLAARQWREAFERSCDDLATLRTQLAEAEEAEKRADRKRYIAETLNTGAVNRISKLEATIAAQAKRIAELERVRDMHWNRCNERGERITRAIEVLSTARAISSPEPAKEGE